MGSGGWLRAARMRRGSVVWKPGVLVQEKVVVVVVVVSAEQTPDRGRTVCVEAVDGARRHGNETVGATLVGSRGELRGGRGDLAGTG